MKFFVCMFGVIALIGIFCTLVYSFVHEDKSVIPPDWERDKLLLNDHYVEKFKTCEHSKREGD